MTFIEFTPFFPLGENVFGSRCSNSDHAHVRIFIHRANNNVYTVMLFQKHYNNPFDSVVCTWFCKTKFILPTSDLFETHLKNDC